MPEESATSTERDESELQRPEFNGCMFCYSAELAAFAVRKVIR